MITAKLIFSTGKWLPAEIIYYDSGVFGVQIDPQTDAEKYPPTEITAISVEGQHTIELIRSDTPGPFLRLIDQGEDT
jgi:hypothetical protein